MDKIAIIIVHYNTDEETRDCLRSLQKIKAKNFSIHPIVVDNASKDNLVLPKDLKNIDLIRSDSNLGFTGGNNLGFRYAVQNYNPDYFLLLNSDTLVEPNFLENLYQALLDNPRAGLASPKIYFAPGCQYHQDSYKKTDQGHILWYAGAVIDWRNLQTIHLGVDELDRGQFDQETTIDYASGCCLLIRREALAVSGIFSDQYFLYYEDTDLSLRLKKHNWQLLYCPTSHIWHKNGSSSLGSGSDLQNFYLTRNRLLFFFLYSPWRGKLTVIKFALNLLKNGSRVEKKAARKFLLRKFGKEVVI